MIDFLPNIANSPHVNGVWDLSLTPVKSDLVNPFYIRKDGEYPSKFKVLIELLLDNTYKQIADLPNVNFRYKDISPIGYESLAMGDWFGSPTIHQIADVEGLLRFLSNYHKVVSTGTIRLTSHVVTGRREAISVSRCPTGLLSYSGISLYGAAESVEHPNKKDLLRQLASAVDEMLFNLRPYIVMTRVTELPRWVSDLAAAVGIDKTDPLYDVVRLYTLVNLVATFDDF